MNNEEEKLLKELTKDIEAHHRDYPLNDIYLITSFVADYRKKILQADDYKPSRQWKGETYKWMTSDGRELLRKMSDIIHSAAYDAIIQAAEEILSDPEFKCGPEHVREEVAPSDKSPTRDCTMVRLAAATQTPSLWPLESTRSLQSSLWPTKMTVLHASLENPCCSPSHPWLASKL